MKRMFSSVALLLAAATAAQAQGGQQTVTYEVTAINQLSVAGSPSLTVTTATAGSAPTAATAAGTYSITTNESTNKVVAAINTDMPAGLTLTVSLAAPAGGTSAGAQSLSSSATDVLPTLAPVNASGLAINYSLAATVAAGVVVSATKTVTFTIVAAS